MATTRFSVHILSDIARHFHPSICRLAAACSRASVASWNPDRLGTAEAPKRARARAHQGARLLFPVGSQPFSQGATTQKLPFSLCSMPNLSWRALLGWRLVFGWVSCTHSQVRNTDHTLQPSPARMLVPTTHPPIAHTYIRAWHARMVVASGVDETVFPIVVQCIVSVPLTCHPDFLSLFLSRLSLPMCPPGPIPLRLAQAPKRRVKSQGRRLCRFLMQKRR